jgi:hypothetical protein
MVLNKKTKKRFLEKVKENKMETFLISISSNSDEINGDMILFLKN